MTIFVTGATGFIGFPVAATLARVGHDVYGLTRSQEKAAHLSAAEIAPVIGDMATPNEWIASARRADVVIHCAAEYSPRYMELDRQTVDHLIGLRSPLFLYTSGCWLYGATGDTPVDETAAIHPPAAVTPRVETERAILAANTPSARTLIIRPGCVYGGEGSLTAAWFASAKNEGATRIVGDGNFRWAMVHNADLAELYRLTAESNLAGEVLNAVDSGSHTVLECARAVARTVTGSEKVFTTPLADAANQMGGMAECLIMNQRLTSAKATGCWVGKPRHSNFIDGVGSLLPFLASVRLKCDTSLRRMTKHAYLPAMALAALLFPAPLRGEGSDCATLLNFKLPGAALTITKAEAIPTTPANTLKPFPWMDTIPASIGPYCRVDGEMEPRTGVDGKHYAIGFAIALPDNWNGRFLFQGGGGLNGSVGNPLGLNAAGDVPALARGFAVVATDTGHKGEVFDGSFFRDQEASLNFAYLAVGKVAVVAKAIIAARYGRPAKYSYFSGCSTGGREGMLMTQRYPTYFDGVISGAPAMRTDFSGLGDKWVAVTLNSIAGKDAAGKPLPAFTNSERKLIVGALLTQCDAKDGIGDGMIFDTQGCRFDSTPLTCQGGKTDACLTKEQVAGLQKAFAGPKDFRGNAVYPGFPFDTGITSTAGIPGLLVSSANPVGPPFTETQMDVDAAALAARNNPAGALTATTWTNLSTYSGHNGKLLFYHGMSDPWFSAWDTLDYYQNMAKANGGMEKTLNWSRIYLVPGMGHCGGGATALDNFDLLTPLVDWVEKGEAPASVTAKGKAFPKRSRPLCAYPTHAQYKGQGDPEDSRSFDCVQ